MLGNAAFTGFEGALLTIALASLLPSVGVAIAFAICGGLVFVLFKRIIEGKDLPILAAISLGLFLIPQLQGGLGFVAIAIVAGAAGVGAIAVTAFFRLVYQIVSRFF
ncbi:hypothetical protein V0288_21810 [Pannus brasiliensis CCIBt3594]|uniref:Uncharacterized protein n=1 Tax=Pannus brasiliensis CCIBt3594 TaxID=1427578 RepID=A0AAW9R1B9_9CHRO